MPGAGLRACRLLHANAALAALSSGRASIREAVEWYYESCISHRWYARNKLHSAKECGGSGHRGRKRSSVSAWICGASTTLLRMYRLPFLVGVLFTVLSSAHGQWTIEESHTTVDLRGIHNVGNGVAWASGNSGTVLRTTDDGTNWQTCAIPPGAEKLDFRGIQAFDAKTAVLMSSGKGDLSRLYKTTDGCLTWKLLFTNPDKDGSWNAIRFRFDPVLNPTPEFGEGVLLGDPVNGNFVIYTTRNKGDTWAAWTPNHPAAAAVCVAKARKGESLFAASNTAAIAPGVNGPFAFVTGGIGGARLFLPQPHSPFDNGTTWKFTVTRLPFISNETSGAFSVASRPIGQFYADLMVVGGDSRTPDAAGTAAYVPLRNDFFGLLPQKIVNSSHPPHGFRSAVAYDANSKTWMTVGPNGTDISTDDGRNWRARKPDPTHGDTPDADRNWNALSLPFVVGPNGRIGKLNANAFTP